MASVLFSASLAMQTPAQASHEFKGLVQILAGTSAAGYGSQLIRENYKKVFQAAKAIYDVKSCEGTGLLTAVGLANLDKALDRAALSIAQQEGKTALVPFAIGAGAVLSGIYLVTKGIQNLKRTEKTA